MWGTGYILHCCYHVLQVCLLCRWGPWGGGERGLGVSGLFSIKLEDFFFLSFKYSLVILTAVQGSVTWTCLKKLQFLTCELSDVLSWSKVSTLCIKTGTVGRIFGKLRQETWDVFLVQAKSAWGLPLGPALLPTRYVTQQAHIRCYTQSTRRTDVRADDQEGKVGKVLLWACFWAYFFRKEEEDFLKLPTGSSNIIFLP